MYICVCAAVKSAQIEEELHKGADLTNLQMNLGVACNCQCCLDVIKEMLGDKYPDGTVQTDS